ncbi:MAG: DegT/DnrJ/EryC1/StrS family aminotransferase [Candidatus Krumholzibacteria bacterium]|nr:DegT/DnrJ/EryC1/StrS family aminotransferase [Candidatus Krumholzibacteria bacterium]
MRVKLLDLVPQYRTVEEEVRAAIEEVASTQMFILGPAVEKFEREIAAYCGTKFAVGVASGSDALLLALMACGVGKGDEVVTTPYTFFSTVSSITRLGARPLFADIDPATYNIDPESVERLVGERTKAIMPVHLFGQTADMDPILEVAKPRGISVIEDACQSIGGVYKGRKAGALGTAGCFSFFPSKNLGGFGDGGMVTTDDEAFAARLGSLRMHGSRERYYHDEVGLNSRLDALQAAVLGVKLRHLDGWNDGRRRNASKYTTSFEALGGVIPPVEAESCTSVFNQYIIRAKKRDELMRFLREREIGCEIYYPVPLHLQKCFRYLGGGEGDCPEAERAAKETLALPVYPELTEEQLDFVVETVGEFMGTETGKR